MPIILRAACTTVNIQQECNLMNQWYNSDLPQIKQGHYFTISDFFDDFINPLLPDTQSVIDWTKLLLNYVKQEAPVLAIRNYSQYMKVTNSTNDQDGRLAYSNGFEIGKDNPYVLRRGFLTEFSNSGYKYFFTDNFFTAYFLKMAYDGFVPELSDFVDVLNNQSFPGRFGQSCKEEREKAVYDITGKVAKDPGIKKRGYKIAHVVDTGLDYIAQNTTMGLTAICNSWFPRGSYRDWQKKGSYYCRTMQYIGGIDFLKAHFLRFACPMNYFPTPKANYKKIVFQSYGDKSKYVTNKPDIAELPELQEFMIGKFHKLYGSVYENFLTAIMWRSTLQAVKNELVVISNKMTSLGLKVIDLTVYDISQAKSSSLSRKSTILKHASSSKTSSNKNIITHRKRANIGQGVGGKARTGFCSRIPRMSSITLKNLQDKTYCKSAFGINYPVLSTKRIANRYYSESINGYFICKEWYAKNEKQLDDWLKSNP